KLPAIHVPGPLRGGEPAAEGARRVLRRFFERMLAREDAVRTDEDPEDVHQMRVATRRLRAALQVAEDLFAPQVIRVHRRGLRRVAASLGALRDADVFLAALLAHRDTLPQQECGALEPLAAAVAAEREAARARLRADLQEGRYTRFKRRFAAFLTTPGAGVATLPETGAPPRVRDVAPSAIWRRYEQLRAFEVVLPGAPEATLHRARIAGKRLRYTLEFFADALGPRVEELLAPLAALQEALGALQDAAVARAYVRALGLAEDAGACDYLATLDETCTRRLADLPHVWEKVVSATYRRRLSELIVKC
ncbi:MAG TPA: CHAD domain-containing protein, partial [Roseiflexaceae bacterium]|nr:CHAD domain-containing protein [Roseiflexaceae bacterium]